MFGGGARAGAVRGRWGTILVSAETTDAIRMDLVGKQHFFSYDMKLP